MENDKERREEHFQFHTLAGHIARLRGLFNWWELTDDLVEKKQITEYLRREIERLEINIAAYYKKEEEEDNEKKKNSDYHI